MPKRVMPEEGKDRARGRLAGAWRPRPVTTAFAWDAHTINALYRRRVPHAQGSEGRTVDKTTRSGKEALSCQEETEWVPPEWDR